MGTLIYWGGIGLVGWFLYNALKMNRRSNMAQEFLESASETGSVKGYADIADEWISPTRVISNPISMLPFRAEEGQFGTVRQMASTDSGRGYYVPSTTVLGVKNAYLNDL